MDGLDCMGFLKGREGGGSATKKASFCAFRWFFTHFLSFFKKGNFASFPLQPWYPNEGEGVCIRVVVGWSVNLQEKEWMRQPEARARLVGTLTRRGV